MDTVGDGEGMEDGAGEGLAEGTTVGDMNSVGPELGPKVELSVLHTS